MTCYLTLEEVLYLHRRVTNLAGGPFLVRDLNALRSAVAQPRMTFGGEDLYIALEEKAAALCFSLIQNHPFIDGNKRLGHAALETFLSLNGYEISASDEEAERLVLSVASGNSTRQDLVKWVKDHIQRQLLDRPD